jgi:hypothetical protein
VLLLLLHHQQKREGVSAPALKEEIMMWDEVVAKIEHLAAFDKQLQVFGAQQHRYQLEPCVPEESLVLHKRWLGAHFPDELKAFYTEVGNGIAGPHYGLRCVDAVTGYHANRPYTDVATLRAEAIASGRATESDKYFSVEREQLTGLITIIDEGCGHEMCLVTAGSRVGEVVTVSADGYVHETNLTLLQTYEQWLDREIAKFELVNQLMSSGASLDEIKGEVRTKFDTLDAEDMIASVADVEKPVSLFGTEYNRIYHGATQTPWYETVLRAWQRVNP